MAGATVQETEERDTFCRCQTEAAFINGPLTPPPKECVYEDSLHPPEPAEGFPMPAPSASGAHGLKPESAVSVLSG